MPCEPAQFNASVFKSVWRDVSPRGNGLVGFATFWAVGIMPNYKRVFLLRKSPIAGHRQLPASIPTIHHKIAPCEETTGVRREEDHSGCYFSRFANARHGRKLHPALIPFGVCHTTLGHWSIDVSRRNAVDADASFCPLPCQR